MSNVIWKEIRSTFQRNDSMVYQLVLVNAVIFLLLQLLRLPMYLINLDYNITAFTNDLGLPASFTTLLHQPWTMFTYMFTHFEFMHIVFNLLLLFWFGKVLTEFAGHRRLLPVYLLGGICGGFFYMIAYNIFPVFDDSVNEARAYGASASVMAIIFAAVTLVPDYTMFLFFFGAVKIKWIALVLVIIDLISIPDSNPGGHIAHLGGALFGFLYVKQLQSGRDLGIVINNVGEAISNFFKRGSKLKVSYRKNEKSNSFFQTKQTPSEQERIDTILDKISQSGYESLTKEEKEFLFKVSKDDLK
ncbi:MAG: rhomboid family intramembrane serine protease [Chitinophagales bacterium]|nr:rhomboid family intramembrane serine protease [Chitinophagales bacterium]